jgi:hypothetical protein
MSPHSFWSFLLFLGPWHSVGVLIRTQSGSVWCSSLVDWVMGQSTESTYLVITSCQGHIISMWLFSGAANLDHWLREYLPSFSTFKLLPLPLSMLHSLKVSHLIQPVPKERKNQGKASKYSWFYGKTTRVRNNLGGASRLCKCFLFSFTPQFWHLYIDPPTAQSLCHPVVTFWLPPACPFRRLSLTQLPFIVPLFYPLCLQNCQPWLPSWISWVALKMYQYPRPSI